MLNAKPALAIVAFAALSLAAGFTSASPAPRLQDDASPSIEREPQQVMPLVPASSSLNLEAPKAAPKARFAKAPKAKSYACGAFGPLQNDAVQQVKRCEWR